LGTQLLDDLAYGISSTGFIPPLKDNHPDFGKAIAMLQAAMYQIDELDEAAVMQALLDGH
jgi:hypothetical protein